MIFGPLPAQNQLITIALKINCSTELSYRHCKLEILKTPTIYPYDSL